MHDMYDYFPEQFKRANFYSVANAFQTKMEEVETVMASLKNIRDLDNAIGKNLDNLGSIMGMTRAQASQLIKRQTITLLSDDDYRTVLKCIVYRNANSCAQDDVIGCIYYALGIRVKISQGTTPAKMFIECVDSATAAQVQTVIEMPWIRGAGIQYEITTPIETDVGSTNVYQEALIGQSNQTTMGGTE